MRRTLRPEPLILFGYVALLAALVSVATLWSRRDFQDAETARRVAQSHVLIERLEALQGALVDAETGQRGYVITGRPDFLGAYDESEKEVARDLDALATLVAAHPGQARRLELLRPLVASKLAFSRAILAARREGFAGAADRVAGGEGKLLMDGIRRLAGEMQAEERRRLDLRMQDLAEAVRHRRRAVLAVSVLLVLLMTGLGVAIAVALRLRAQALAQLDRIANADPLTGLPNRRLLVELSRAALTLAERKQRPAAVLFLDLDGFKAVNDAHGHEAGDRLLVEVARRLRARLRGSDIVARLGGDEFVVVLLEISAEEDAAGVAEKILQDLADPYALAGEGGPEGRVTTSVGVAVFPRHGLDIEALLKAADAALYAAKRKGKNRVEAYEGP